MGVDDAFDGLEDVEVADAPGVERRDRLLVRGVEHGGICAPGRADALRQCDRRERFAVEGFERPGMGGRPVERHTDPGDTVRPVEAERDGQAHVGRGRLGDGRAVDELHHRVDNGLRMHGHFDPLVRHVEQHMRFDHFEALVDERGRVRRHDEPHVPRRVGQGLSRRDVTQGFAAAPAEGPTGCGQHQPGDLRCGP